VPTFIPPNPQDEDMEVVENEKPEELEAIFLPG